MKISTKIVMGYIVVIFALILILGIVKYTISNVEDQGSQTVNSVTHMINNLESMQNFFQGFYNTVQSNIALISSGYLSDLNQVEETQKKFDTYLYKGKELLLQSNNLSQDFVEEVSSLFEELEDLNGKAIKIITNIIEKNEEISNLGETLVNKEKSIQKVENQLNELLSYNNTRLNEEIEKLRNYQEDIPDWNDFEGNQKLRNEVEKSLNVEDFGIWGIEKFWNKDIMPHFSQIEGQINLIKLIAREILIQDDVSEETINSLNEAVEEIENTLQFVFDGGYFVMNPVEAVLINETIKIYHQKVNEYSQLSFELNNLRNEYTFLTNELSTNQNISQKMMNELNDLFSYKLVPTIETFSNLVEREMKEIQESTISNAQIISSNARNTLDEINSVFNTTLITTLIVICLIILITYFLNRSISGTLRKTNRLAEMILNKDLSQPVELSNKKDEISNVHNAFIEVANSMKKMLNELKVSSNILKQNSESTASAVEEYSAISEEISGEINNYSDTLTVSVNKLQNISNSLIKVKENSEQLSYQAEKSVKDAENFKLAINEDIKSVLEVAEDNKQITKDVENNISNMQELLKVTKDVSSFVENIKTIAEQTNLLSLNAAIEAARAGEAGKGFAVVAEEVRKLAEDSEKMATDVQNAVQKMEKTVNFVAQSTSKTGRKVEESAQSIEKLSVRIKKIQENIGNTVKTIENLKEFIENENDLIIGISNETTKISEDFEETSKGILNFKENLNDVAKAMENLTKESQKLLELSDSINFLVEGYKL